MFNYIQIQVDLSNTWCWSSGIKRKKEIKTNTEKAKVRNLVSEAQRNICEIKKKQRMGSEEAVRNLTEKRKKARRRRVCIIVLVLVVSIDYVRMYILLGKMQRW